VLKVKIMEKAITPKSARTPIVKHNFDGIFSAPGVLAQWWVRKPGNETASVNVFRPGLCGKNPVKQFFTQLNSGLKNKYGRVLTEKLIINSMETKNKDTGDICTWKRQSFRDYDNKAVYRLVLHEINKEHADSFTKAQQTVAGGGLQPSFCAMKKRETWGCEGLSKS